MRLFTSAHRNLTKRSVFLAACHWISSKIHHKFPNWIWKRRNAVVRKLNIVYVIRLEMTARLTIPNVNFDLRRFNTTLHHTNDQLSLYLRDNESEWLSRESSNTNWIWTAVCMLRMCVNCRVLFMCADWADTPNRLRNASN